MMQGLAGLVRARQYVWLTDEVRKQIEIELPYDDGTNECPHVDVLRCQVSQRKPIPDPHNHAMPSQVDMPMGRSGSMPGMDMSLAATQGLWELLPCDSQVLAVHGAVMHTGKVAFLSGSGNNLNNHIYRAVVWDYENGGFKAITTPTDIFCAGHAFLSDGRLLVAGGTKSYNKFPGETTAYLLDPILEDFIRVADMADGRWYPTLVSLPDGHLIAISGWSVQGDPVMNDRPEHYSYQSNWTAWAKTMRFPLYPHLFLQRDGRLFYSGGHVFGTHNIKPGWLNLVAQSYTPMTAGIPASFDLDHRDQSASVLLPPAQDQKVMIMGGGDPGINAVHTIDLKAATAVYHAVARMHYNRIHLNAVLLPDRTVFVSGGETNSEKATTAALQSEIYHPSTNTWTLGATASVPRMYHSIAMLLPDGRVITAGSNPEANTVAGGELRLELYHPPYLFRGPRPFIQATPQEWQYGATIEIHTPQAEDIQWVQIIRPMATTHSWDSNQRLVDIPFKPHGLCHIEAQVQREATIAPPGWYMLFITDRRGIPSVAKWIHLQPQSNSVPPRQLGQVSPKTSGAKTPRSTQSRKTQKNIED